MCAESTAALHEGVRGPPLQQEHLQSKHPASLAESGQWLLVGKLLSPSTQSPGWELIRKPFQPPGKVAAVFQPQ